ncbi:TonB C-terminal domain-containing protein [Sulfurimonas sp.]|uniref:TonB C-terminal domain-containing protein n=1 Tax=Sulfurimonas sp. TaxID=2022749 RepID=UPI003D0D02E7
MVREEKYFYISGFISLFIFLTFLFLFAGLLFSVNTTKTYGLKKDNFVSISLATPVMMKQLSQKKSTQAISIPEASEVPKNVDVNDLFSDVWTQKIDNTKTRPKEVNSKRIQEISKRVQTSKQKEVASLSEKIQNIDTTTNDKERQSSSSAEEVNEYLAKIQAIVYDNFSPPMNSEGNIVKIVIEIDPIGKMLDFRVLNYSSNESLNQEADKMKQKLSSVIFPKNPEHQKSRVIIQLIPENKE